ncbi:MAG: hypothetical protein DRG78_01935 [Epsilonproteobacteria bacterium]|nr:MAG: hypothetical protein DRG78_01935 [Campylobacterota bacterium]
MGNEYRYFGTKQKKKIDKQIIIKKDICKNNTDDNYFLKNINYIYLIFFNIINIPITIFQILWNLITFDFKDFKNHFFAFIQQLKLIYQILRCHFKELLIGFLFMFITVLVLPVFISLTANYLTLQEKDNRIESKLNDIKFNTSTFYSYTKTEFEINIYFENGKSLIDINNKNKLENFLSKIDNTFKYIVSIEGFASSEPLSKTNNNYENNYELSLARALNIKKNIIDLLLKRNKSINIKFNLSAQATEKSTSNHQESRKVEIKFYKWKNKKEILENTKQNTLILFFENSVNNIIRSYNYLNQ